MRLLPFFALLTACSDYDLSSHDDEPKPSRHEDTGEPVVDTDTAPVDTGDTDEDTVTVPNEEVATEPVYINTDTTLYSYDPDTNTATRIGEFLEGGRAVSGGMTDIAISLDGIMFGGSFTTLYRINPTTAECTRVASLDDEMTGLTFVSDGSLVGAGEGVSFVDTRTGALTTLVAPGEYSTSGDIIGLPDGMLYWTVTGGDDLIQIDPSSGETRRRGSVGVQDVFGLGYAYGQLLGFTSDGTVELMESSNGRSTDSLPLSGRWWGATTNPVLW